MNEYMANKLGEVVALARNGIECQQKAAVAFQEAFRNNPSMADLSNKLKEFEQAALKTGNNKTVEKADKTEEKLRNMMESYIGDDWSNSTEVLEWLGFYFGAASAHWALIVGASSMEGVNDLRIVAEEAVAYHKGCLEVVSESLRQRGIQKMAAQ